MLCCLSAASQDIRSQQAKKEKIEREMAILDKQLSDNKAKSRSALNLLDLSRRKVNLQQELLSQSDKQIREYSNAIYSKQLQINSLQRQVDTLSVYYSRLVHAAYKNRDTKIWYMYILASSDLSQGMRRYSYFKNLSTNLKVQATKLRETRAALEVEKEELQQLKKQSEALRAQRAKEQTSLVRQKEDNQKIVNKLQRNRKQYEKELSEKRRQVEALNREIQRIIAAATGRSSGKTEIDQALSAEFSKNKGILPWPVDGSVVGKFGQHYHPVFTTVKLPFNNGVDIEVASGTKAQAIFEGVVKQIVVLPGYNQCVLVQHGEYFSLYCRLGSVKVKAGDKVKTGQAIGVVDTINSQTQLHFEIWKGQTPQNPELWLK